MELTKQILKRLILEMMEGDDELYDAIMDRLNEAMRLPAPAAIELIQSTIDLGVSLDFFNEPRGMWKSGTNHGRRVIIVDYRGDPEGFTKFGTFLKNHSGWLDVSKKVITGHGFYGSEDEAPETRGMPAFTPLFNVSFMLFSPVDIGN